jgi:hypothetical protein
MKRPLLFLLFSFLCLVSSQAGISVIGTLARTATIKPGEAFEGVIMVRNTGLEPAEARVSQSDYLSRCDGTNEFGQAGQGPRSNANWITLSPSRLKLAPGETQPVRYKGRAPADAKLRGSYWSLILVELNAAPAITPEGKPDTVAVGLQTAVRFAVQIVTEIGNTGTRSLQVLEKSLLKSDGHRLFQLDIGNDGERMLIPAISVELFDQKGASPGRFDAGRARIYPGGSARAKVDLTDLPCGKYIAMVLLDSGDAQVMGAQYELDLQP